MTAPLSAARPSASTPPVGALPRRKIALLGAVLIAFNVTAWLWALIAFRDYPLMLGTALLAYSLGLRHAVDADHIAAIDNVTRKLMQQGQQPVAVGFMFSLGHSTVVVLASAAIAATAQALQQKFEGFRAIGGLIGTSVSALFLFVIAALNLIVLRGVWRAFQRVRRGEPYVEEDFDLLIGQRGLLARLFGPLFRLVSRSWHMYPLGLLFGLGFDTATEIGLLGISAAQASHGLPMWSILVFPVLFTAGMALVDTADNVLMLGAYRWAFVKPVRKLYYNLTITFVSVLIAVLVGGVEALGLAIDKLQLKGRVWDVAGGLADNLGNLGYGIVGVFVVSWLVSAAIYRWRRFDELDALGSRSATD
jgi:high-affinity nickel-transport protein